MLISKTVLSSFVLSLSIHCAGIFALMPPAEKSIVPLEQTCAYTEVTFIDSQALCAVMEVKETPLTQEDKDFKKETGLNLKDIQEEEIALSKKGETLSSGSQNKSLKHSEHSGKLDNSSADKENAKDVWRVLKCPMPIYPQEARKNLQEGEVIVEITVSASGKIASSKVILSSGFSAIDQAALKASKRVILKYKGLKPASSGVTLRIPYQFKLK
jgi:TonB family protein